VTASTVPVGFAHVRAHENTHLDGWPNSTVTFRSDVSNQNESAGWDVWSVPLRRYHERHL